MMNYIWSIIILVSVIIGALNGRIAEVSTALLQGGNQAIELIISLLGAMCLWNGLMKIAEDSGLTEYIAKLLQPIVNIFLPGLKKGGKAVKAVCMNITANLLGLGNAATPLGLNAMKCMAEEESTGETASNNMVNFVVLNTASIELIPTTAAMLRAKHGAVNPMDIVPCVWICSIVALAVGLIVSRLLQGRVNKSKAKQKPSKLSPKGAEA